MGAWWDEEKTLWLVTPEEFERLPDGFMLTCIDGEIVIKGKDHIDMDTRVGHIAYGITKEAVDAALNMEREKCVKAAKEALLKINYGELHADANYVNELGEAIAAAIRRGE